MPDLHLIINQPAPGDWYGRLDVAEALEADGWTGGDDGQLLGKNGAFWGVTNETDDSSLTCPDDTVIDFPSTTQAVVIVAACLAAAAQGQICNSEFPGDDLHVGQLCERQAGHGGDHWCMAPIAGTSYRRQLAWPTTP